MDANERATRARLAAHTKWAKTEDTTAATAAARAAFNERFEREVDPDGKLPPAERARRAEHARKAYFTRLSLKRTQASQKRKRAQDLRAQADRLDAAAETEEREQGSRNP